MLPVPEFRQAETCNRTTITVDLTVVRILALEKVSNYSMSPSFRSFFVVGCPNLCRPELYWADVGEVKDEFTAVCSGISVRQLSVGGHGTGVSQPRYD